MLTFSKSKELEYMFMPNHLSLDKKTVPRCKKNGGLQKTDEFTGALKHIASAPIPRMEVDAGQR